MVGIKQPNDSQYYVDKSEYRDSSVYKSSDEELGKLGLDPTNIDRDFCTKLLNDRIAKREKFKVLHQNAKAALEDNPFDARTEVSADAKHIARRIVIHLWIVLFGLPFAFFILYELVSLRYI